jgi:hypothetical protein
VFCKVFLVQIRRKLQKIHYEVRIQGKKKLRKTRSEELGAKTEIQGGKRVTEGGKRKFWIL